jgi:hypothetical protein
MITVKWKRVANKIQTAIPLFTNHIGFCTRHMASVTARAILEQMHSIVNKCIWEHMTLLFGATLGSLVKINMVRACVAGKLALADHIYLIQNATDSSDTV